MSAPSITADAPARAAISIGEWFADPESNELRHGSATLRIEPKAMEVLMLLADRAGRVVSREELFDAVWPGVVVGDEALTQSIIKLRRALGDNTRSPSYIETIAKRGYRLIAPVQRSAVGAISSEPADAPAAPKDPPYWKQWRLRGWLAGLVVASMIAVLAMQRLSSPAGFWSTAPSEDAAQTPWVSVTVAPFESFASNDEQAYLARGISDTLISDLSRLSGLRVIRESRSGATDAPASRARYRVSGTVQREAGMLRINVHLADTVSNEQLWSVRFERPVGDLFAIQDEMTATLVELLPAKVSDLERQRLAKRYTRSLDAYDYFLRGRALFLVRGGEQNEEARAFYRKALERDPKFARAYAGLAMTYAMDNRLGKASDASLALERAFDLARTAREIDPDVPEVYWALGFIHAQSRRHGEAIQALQRAIELDASFADAYALLGGIHTYVGEPAKAIPLLRTAMRLNSDAGYLYFLLLGRAYLFQNDVEQALINLRAASMRNPADVETHVYLSAAAGLGGDSLAARWEADEIRSLEPGFSIGRWLEHYPMTSAPQREQLLALLSEVGL